MQKAATMMVLVIASLASAACAEIPTKEVLAPKLMKLSGMEEQIRQIPPQILSSLAEQKGQMPADTYASFSQAMRGAFSAEQIEKSAVKQATANLTVEIMQKALDWLESGLGRKITSLEEAASTPHAVQQIQALAGRLKSVSLPPHRLELIQRLDSATQATDLSLSITETAMMAVATALDAIQPKELQVGTDTLKKQLEQQRPQLRQNILSMTTAAGLFAYQTLSDVELDRYIEFLESAAGKQYQTGMNAALKGALAEASERAGKNLADAVRTLRMKEGA
ncbi:MAG TPA: hypothetical protein VGQ07_01490 [Nitrospirales bacterium]|jgi:ribosomal protein S7|nr:hypothetical protein [Nitrospirales bacterium]